ncbi:MAG TPA: hypothetical protein VNH13_10480 [Candidatus Acidoferrales bacterium]|nr:hypothetical protein [Candidatus Acidoferrales bacterium]
MHDRQTATPLDPAEGRDDLGLPGADRARPDVDLPRHDPDDPYGDPDATPLGVAQPTRDLKGQPDVLPDVEPPEADI